MLARRRRGRAARAAASDMHSHQRDHQKAQQAVYTCTRCGGMWPLCKAVNCWSRRGRSHIAVREGAPRSGQQARNQIILLEYLTSFAGMGPSVHVIVSAEDRARSTGRIHMFTASELRRICQGSANRLSEWFNVRRLRLGWHAMGHRPEARWLSQGSLSQGVAHTF